MKLIGRNGPFLKENRFQLNPNVAGIELDVLNSWRVIPVNLLPLAPDFSTWCSISGEWRR